MLIYNLILFISILVHTFVMDILPDHRAEIEIPDHAIRTFARVCLPSILEMLSTEEGRQTLEQWKKEYREYEEQKQQAEKNGK